MAKILVTGANGQLGNELRVLAGNYPQFRFAFTDVDRVDIADYDQLAACVAEEKPDYIINCAAYTAVDKAESEAELAYKINAEAVRYFTFLAQDYNFKLIHISTDYVFNGAAVTPYRESDETRPTSVYGQTKLEGEMEISNSKIDAIVIRTSWLYSSFGHNFVKTMMRVGAGKEVLPVVYDQVGSPTYAADLADTILQIIHKTVQDPSKFTKGIYHYANEGVASWYDFAIEIFNIAGIYCHVNPIETKDYPTVAVRPHYSVFSKSKIKKQFGISIPHWKESLTKCVDIIRRRAENNAIN